MKFSSPGEVDEPAEPEAGESAPEPTPPETVTVFGSETTLTEAVELMGEMLDKPEAFGMVSESQHAEVVERVEELEAENERMAESLRQVYSIMDEADKMSQFSLNESVYDPTEEFK